MSLLFEDAIKELADENITIEKIFDIVKRTSGSVRNATNETIYYLYTGQMLDGSTYSSQIVSELKKAGAGVDVVSSEVGQLLKSDELRKALSNAVRLDVLGDTPVVSSPLF